MHNNLLIYFAHNLIKITNEEKAIPDFKYKPA